MGKKRLIDALHGQTTDMAAWVPYAGVHCAHLLGENADVYLKDPAMIAQGVVNAAKTYRADGIPLLFDLSLEAHALGCQLKWWQDNVPSVASHPCSGKTPPEAGLQAFDKDTGRWPLVFDAAARAKPLLDELDCGMMGLVCGPLTLASHLAGVRIFTDCYKNREFAKAVLSFAEEICARSAAFYVEMGADIVALVDPVASQVKQTTFREFVAPYTKPAWKVIHDAGVTSSYFICGDCSTVIEDVCAIGAQSIAVDEQLDLGHVRELARKQGVGFAGNLKLTMALSLGLVSPREDALVSLATGGRTGYVLAPGCDMPFDVPEEHVLQVVEARDWFVENYAAHKHPEGR